MAENEPDQAENQDETPRISVPSHAPLPPPPDVPYSRPTLGRSVSTRTQSGTSPSGMTGGHSSVPENEPASLASHGAGMAAGITFATSIIVGAVIGNWIDGRWNHTGMPWATLVMTLLGGTAGFMNMMRLLSRSDRNKK